MGWRRGYLHELAVKVVVCFRKTPMQVYLYSVKMMYGWGFANTLTFAFTNHLYLVCILFGMTSLHLFTFLMFFQSCFCIFFLSNMYNGASSK